jgi:long-chain fatty acid transport protein
MALAGLAGSAFATNGMFSHGYGMKSKGMAGASTAMSDDAFAGANNPAAAAFSGNRIDLGVDVFSPRRDTSNSNIFGSGSAAGVDSDAHYFLIPEMGYNQMFSDSMALGVTVYGNGGMNTDYPVLGGAFGNTNSLGGQGALGVDLMQLIVAPTAAFKIAPNHSIGISPLIGYEKFAATGLQGFVPLSSDGAAVTNQGNDDAWGFGVRIGYMGKIGADVTIGASYASKVNFSELKKYQGLFAEQGNLDLPENYSLGVAWQVTPEVKLAADYQRINYSGVAAIGNASGNPFPLGSDNGPGFGWSDMNVWKLGGEYKLSQQMTLRAGYSHAKSPIDGSQPLVATFNILAPGVIEDHLTLGFTYTMPSGDEMTMAYMHAFENNVSGARPAGFGGGTDTTTMYENSLGFQYSWKM